jgi:hypothetical protein
VKTAESENENAKNQAEKGDCDTGWVFFARLFENFPPTLRI